MIEQHSAGEICFRACVSAEFERVPRSLALREGNLGIQDLATRRRVAPREFALHDYICTESRIVQP